MPSKILRVVTGKQPFAKLTVGVLTSPIRGFSQPPPGDERGESPVYCCIIITPGILLYFYIVRGNCFFFW